MIFKELWSKVTASPSRRARKVVLCVLAPVLIYYVAYLALSYQIAQGNKQYQLLCAPTTVSGWVWRTLPLGNNMCAALSAQLYQLQTMLNSMSSLSNLPQFLVRYILPTFHY